MRLSPSSTTPRTPSVIPRANRQYRCKTRRSAGSNIRRTFCKFMTAGALLLASGWTPCQNNRDCYRVVLMAAFTLADLSDPHLAPLPAPSLRELVGKRATGYLHWTRRRHEIHRREALDALVAV